MFDGGAPEQIHRFVASSQQPPPLHPHQPAAERSLPFPVSFASFNTNHQAHMLNLDGPKIIHHHHHHHHHDIKYSGDTSEWMGHTNHDGDNHRHHHHHPWCSDEVLSLLRFRSTVENWFPEFTWEHTSRKLAEVGFKRSPQECKEKFEEEERRYFNSNNNTNAHHLSNYNKGNYRLFSEVDEFYHHGHVGDEHVVSSEVGDNQNKRNDSLEGEGHVEETGQDLLEVDKTDQGQVDESSMRDKITSIDNVGKVGNVEDDAKSSSTASLMMIMRDNKKRKRKKKKERFGLVKGFCEGLVKNVIAQQEEMHKKLLEDMMKKEEEKIAREEAWKKQEMERLNKELEIRAHEQTMAGDRNTSIIKFISKFTDHNNHDDGNNKVQSPSPSQDSSSLILSKSQGSRKCQTSSSLQTLTPQNPSLEPTSPKTLKTKTQNPKPPKGDEQGDIGKRWPRDEVLALINIRRSISSMNDDDHRKDDISLSSSSSSTKAVPLWERISKKMLEVGYKRSAKRCKEKWENINKYFRKTKDVNKKRPLDSRTCPYFHQLTALYSQPSTGTTTTVSADTSVRELETQPEENRVGSGDPDIPTAMHVDGAGEKSNVQFSGFDLAF
ncbi:hypothetical protein Bca101_014796 [Brassica carinata]